MVSVIELIVYGLAYCKKLKKPNVIRLKKECFLKIGIPEKIIVILMRMQCY